MYLTKSNKTIGITKTGSVKYVTNSRAFQKYAIIYLS